MFDLEKSLHTHEAARLSGATKASARLLEKAPEAKRLEAMPEHRRLARMAVDSWMASRETDHG